MITFTELLERAKTERIAIHTPTEEQAKELLKALDERGYVWQSGKKLTDITYYKGYKENTCYAFYNSFGRLLDKKIMFAPLSWHQKNDYTIIEFTNIDFKENV